MPNDTPMEAGVDDEPMIELDLRGLRSPEPMVRALAAVDALRPGQVLQVLTPLLPTPLIEMLRSRGWWATAMLLPDGGAKVVIRYPDDNDKTAA